MHASTILELSLKFGYNKKNAGEVRVNSIMALQGLLPLIVFAIVDIFAGLRAGIVAAIIFALLEAGWSYHEFGEVDRLTWISLILIIVMGAIAFKMRSDRLFKFQPVVLSLFMSLALLYFQIFETPLMIQMLPKVRPMLPEANRAVTFEPRMIAMFVRVDAMMVVVFALHAALVAWAAMHRSTLYWLVMRGAALYGMMAVVLLLNLILLAA